MKTFFEFIGKRREPLKKWGVNLLKFAAPMLAVFFLQLSTGVSVQDAFPLLVLALYGALADWLKKISNEQSSK